MSFDETGDLLGDSRRPGMNVTGGANKRRSSHRFEAAQKRRKSKSIGAKLEGDEMLKVHHVCCHGETASYSSCLSLDQFEV